MNDTFSHLITLFSGIGFVWCLKLLVFPKTATAQKDNTGQEVIAVQNTCNRPQTAKNPEVVITKPIHGVGEGELTQTDAAEAKYQNNEIQSFWIANCAKLQEPFLAVIRDVLNRYDNPAGQQTQSRHRIGNPTVKKYISPSDEVFMVLQQVPHFRHMIDIGEEFISAMPIKRHSGPLFCLGLLACLGHGIAKLQPYQKKYSCAEEHASRSAQVMSGIINGRLHPSNEKELLDAIRWQNDKLHNETPILTRLLKTAHAKAIARELHQASIVTLSAGGN